MPSSEHYRGRLCGATDRHGNRCMLPMGHAERNGSAWHQTSIDDQPRVWTTR